MIKNDNEYELTKKRLAEAEENVLQSRNTMIDMGLSLDQVDSAIKPMNAFLLQLTEDIRRYENIKSGDYWSILNFDEIGQLLIAIRISKNISQRELAARLGISETQVSRDERNEYHGATIDRLSRTLKALEFELRSFVNERATVFNQPIQINSTRLNPMAASFNHPSSDQILCLKETTNDYK